MFFDNGNKPLSFLLALVFNSENKYVLANHICAWTEDVLVVPISQRCCIIHRVKRLNELPAAAFRSSQCIIANLGLVYYQYWSE
jgi:hypothetical protein